MNRFIKLKKQSSLLRPIPDSRKYHWEFYRKFPEATKVGGIKKETKKKKEKATAWWN